MLPAAARHARRWLAIPLTWQDRGCSRAVLQAARPRSSSTTTASIAEHQLFLDLCQQHGVRLDPSICLSSTAWGLGLAVACQTQQPHQQPCDDDAVVQVPLDLVLSCSIQGCSPGPQQVTPALQQVLHASEVSQSWEMQVAVLLLWALRQPPQSRIGGFWQQYRPLLPGSVQDCASLLVWSDSELAQLQDESLQATAQQWQKTVLNAYHSAVAPFFDSPAASSGQASRQQVSAAPQPCSLEEWLWAVASVESRAFGAARADVAAAAAAAAEATGTEGGRAQRSTPPAAAAEFTGLVPVLDLANHAAKPGYEHRLDPSTGTFSLFPDSGAQLGHGDALHMQQVLITYGSKDNRQLMEQYGFSLPGNTLDRVSFPPGLLQQQHGWMSHKAVKAAAQQVLARRQQQQHAAVPPLFQGHLDAAVASILQCRGWASAAQYRATSADSTARCAAVMLAFVRHQLDSVPTTAAADWTQLQRLRADAVKQQGQQQGQGRLLAALQYRLERKQLLQAAAEVLEVLAATSTAASLMAPQRPQRQHVQPGDGGAQVATCAAAADDSTLKAWQQQGYPMPDDAGEGSRPDVKLLYRPPRNDARGIAIACGLIAAWVVLFYHGCWQVRLADAPDGSSRRSSWFDIIGTFLLLEFVNTGLFITTHDAMHGTICFRNRKLNDALGRIAITLYAYFDYDMLHTKHWEHHNFTGLPGKDPDFHRGNSNLLVWYARFMWEYTTLLQFAKILLASQLLQALGVPYANLCVYMAAAPLLAAFRLFYYGTYLPHLPPDSATPMPWQKSHSSEDPTWLTFLQCYNFGLHWEHHRFPYAPWWDLPKAKAITRQYKGQQQQQQQQRQPALSTQELSGATVQPAAP